MISYQSTTNDVARPDAKEVKTYITNKYNFNSFSFSLDNIYYFS